MEAILKSKFSNTVFFRTYGVEQTFYGTKTNFPSYVNFALPNRSASGSQNPSWKDQVSRGAQATTPYLASEASVKSEQGYLEKVVQTFASPKQYRTISTVSGDVLRNYALHVAPVVSNDQSALNQAIIQFYSRATEAQTSFAGGAFVGEIKQTIEMIKHPAKSLRNLVRTHASQVIKLVSTARGRKYALKACADLWLEAKFGWQPLVGDIASAMEAYDKLLTDFRPNIVVSGKGSADSVTGVSSTSDGLNGIYYDVNRRTKHMTEAIIRGGIKRTVSGPTSGTAAFLQVYGLEFSLQNVVMTAYELMPWSFLIDYFSNVGGILNAATFANSNVAWACTNIRRTATTEISGVLNAKKSGLGTQYVLLVTGDPGKIDVKSKQIERYVYVPICPSLTFGVPGMDSVKWFNMAALALQRDEMYALLGKLRR